LIGGSFKNADNFIAGTDFKGNQTVRFEPVSAFLTSDALENLCTAFTKSLDKNEHDALLLIPMFILDFLCIHPFNDGNGRMSRLLTLLLLYRAGYIVGKYISFEKLIENSKDTYYEALQSSSDGWHENQNDYKPFVRYYLGILQKAYAEFESRVEYLRRQGLSKPDRIKALIDNQIGSFTKRTVMEFAPDISKVTVERTLTSLVKSGYIEKIGAGPSSSYVKA
jgi:Fic family protein